jgi:hypothetical protein
MAEDKQWRGPHQQHKPRARGRFSQQNVVMNYHSIEDTFRQSERPEGARSKLEITILPHLSSLLQP